MSKFKIEKDIPLPPKTKYPFPQMEVGDSFSFNEDDSIAVKSSVCFYSRKTGKKFRIAQKNRVWRIA